MGLAENVSALATRVATEIKTVRTEILGVVRTKQTSASRWTNFRTRTTGTQLVTGALSDDGTAFLISPTATETASFANNRLEVSWPASTGGALYIQQPTGGVVRRIGAAFAFGPSANTTTAAIALATWDTPSPTPGTTNAQIHLAMTASSATFGVVVAGTVTNLVNWPYFVPLAQDWTTYRAEVTITGSTAYVALPDGQSQTVTDSRIASTQGQTACWEFFRDAATTTAPVAFADVWASTSAPLGGLVSRGHVAKMVNTYRSEVNSLLTGYVPLTLRGPRGGVIAFSNLSGTFTLNFSQEAARWTLTGDVTVNLPAGGTVGVDGQVLQLEVLASGANRVVTFASGFEMSPKFPARQLVVTAGTWTNITVVNRGGTYRLESIDVPIQNPITVIPYAAVPAFNVHVNNQFRVVATGNVTGITVQNLNVDGLVFTIEVFASGAARTFTTTGIVNKSGKTLPMTVTSGTSSYFTFVNSTVGGITLTSAT